MKNGTWHVTLCGMVVMVFAVCEAQAQNRNIRWKTPGNGDWDFITPNWEVDNGDGTWSTTTFQNGDNADIGNRQWSISAMTVRILSGTRMITNT